MATKPKKRRKSVRKRKVNINLTQRVHIVEKNDATRVAKRGIDTIPKRKAPFILNDNGLNMRIKIKRKSR